MQKKSRFRRHSHPNRVFLFEVVIKFLKEAPCLSIRTDLDKLDTELHIRG
jgi:hypothetical protein